MSGELKSGLKGGAIIIGMALLAFAITHAGLHFNEDETISNYLARKGMEEAEIKRILALPRLVKGEYVAISDDFRVAVLVNTSRLSSWAEDREEPEMCFEGMLLYNYKKVGKR